MQEFELLFDSILYSMAQSPGAAFLAWFAVRGQRLSVMALHYYF
jgi:hypothetical protein